MNTKVQIEPVPDLANFVIEFLSDFRLTDPSSFFSCALGLRSVCRGREGHR